MNCFLGVLLGLLVASSCFGQVQPSPAPSSSSTTVAKVLGKDVPAKDADQLSSIIIGTLLERYATEQRIVPTDAELEAFLVATDEAEQRHLADLEARQAAITQELQSTSLTDQQRQTKAARLKTVETSLRGLKPFMEQEARDKEKMRPMKVGIARQVVTKWKVNKALYDQYGGRVIFQQAGDEPMDAYRAFLKEEQARGNFQIFDAKAEARFWEDFNSEPHPLSKEAGDEAMHTPWWMRKATHNP